MAKKLSSITGGKLFRGKSSKEKKFIDKHAVYDEDPNQHQNDNSKKMKMDNRNPYHGYNPGQDEAVYEGKRINALKKALTDHKNSKTRYRSDWTDHANIITQSLLAASHPKYAPVGLAIAGTHAAILAGSKVADITSKYKQNRLYGDKTMRKNVNEGFYKDKDIARQETEHAKKHNPKSIMMDKIADMHKKGQLTPEAKAIALRHMKKMTTEEVFENWDVLSEAMQQYQKDGLKAFSHIMTGKKGKKGSVQYTGVNLKQSFPHKDRKGNVSHLANPNKARWSHPEDREYFEKKKKSSKGILARLFGRKKKINEGKRLAGLKAAVPDIAANALVAGTGYAVAGGKGALAAFTLNQVAEKMAGKRSIRQSYRAGKAEYENKNKFKQTFKKDVKGQTDIYGSVARYFNKGTE